MQPANQNFTLDYKEKGTLQDPSNELKANSIPAQTSPEAVNESAYATEIIALPSKGLCYPSDNPLSSGKVEMKYMTAREEDILTSSNLISKGLVLDKLFQSLIVSKINYDDLLLGDKDTIMLAARILGYGSNYETNMECPRCTAKQFYQFSLSEFKEKIIDESLLNRSNEYSFTIPSTNKVIKFKFLTHADEKLITAEKKANKELKEKMKAVSAKDEVNSDLSLRLKYTIVEVDGKRDKQYINKFIDSFRSTDSLALRKHIKTISPGLDLGFHFECSECGHTAIIDMPIDVSFFWPNA